MSDQFEFADTLQLARERVREKLDDGIICPCCSQFAKRYFRPLHCAMALWLIDLYQLAKREGLDLFFHYSKVHDGHPGDAAKLVYWNLIEPQHDSEKGARNNGFWRITETGRLFVEARISVQQKCVVFNGECVGFDGDEITITEALGDKFSYDELMGLAPQQQEDPTSDY